MYQFKIVQLFPFFVYLLFIFVKWQTIIKEKWQRIIQIGSVCAINVDSIINSNERKSLLSTNPSKSVDIVCVYLCFCWFSKCHDICFECFDCTAHHIAARCPDHRLLIFVYFIDESPFDFQWSECLCSHTKCLKCVKWRRWREYP